MDEKENYAGLVVVVIDLQPPYLIQLDRDRRLSLIRSQFEVVSYYAKQNVPVIGIEMEMQGRTPLLLRRHFKEKPVKKWFRDGFFGTDLEEKLREKQCTDLVMMGLFRSECVHETAGSASHLGFQVYTAVPLITDYPTIKSGCIVSDDQLRSICSLSADNKELFSVIEKRTKSDNKDKK